MLKSNNLLYWKISGVFFMLLTVLGLGYVLITSFVADRYHQEVNQRLYGLIADSTATKVKTLENGEIDKASLQDIMHSMMVINPSVEVYLLDTLGGIITYVAPHKKIKLESVDMAPVKTFIYGDRKQMITGDDPRNPGDRKVFSAAPIWENNKLTGYVYIILASEEQVAVTNNLFGSYILKLGAWFFFLALVLALLVGLLSIWYLTRNLRRIIDTVRRFKEGEFAARVHLKNQGELSSLASHYNEMADTIVANIEELQGVEKLRRELIANVSHDLRTPLAIMQGYVETLLIKEDQLTEQERRKYLHTILDSNEKLAKLIAQLFEYSKLEAKQLEPKKEAFFISELAQDIFFKYQILAKANEVEMDLVCPSNLPMVFADLGMVERVIQNLMDNALKFTPKGGKVTIALNNIGQYVEVKIADTGPGIPEEEQSFIFERYRQAASGVEKKGTGLGLAIVKKMLELHDATIQVQSRLNEGTVFRFQLPSHRQVVFG
ncbi:MAG: HAMP domain-containing sensor histidine kinase [Saprospiraceae bacterium]